MEAFLFLDFDGVLHPEGLSRNKFVHVKAFEAVVRPYVNDGLLGIVISSTWRRNMKLSELRSKFSKDIARGIVGVTPYIPSPGLDLSSPEKIALAIAEPQDPRTGLRQREILQWLALNAPTAPWLALDDDRPTFFRTCENLQQINPSTGLTPRDLQRLAENIEKLLDAPQPERRASMRP